MFNVFHEFTDLPELEPQKRPSQEGLGVFRIDLEGIVIFSQGLARLLIHQEARGILMS